MIGDVLGKGSQTTLPVSKGRKVEFTKWSWMGIGLPEIKLSEWEGDLAKFSLRGCDRGVRIVRNFTEVNNFLSTNTTFDKTKQNQGEKPNLSTIATTKKELGYYGTKMVKPLKIFPPQLVERLNSIGGSRDSFYYQISYLDSGQQVGSFLVDKGWREREFLRVVSQTNLPSYLWLKKGERTDFLVRAG